MDITKLFSSKAIQNMAMGTLRKAMAGNGISFATITYDKINDDLDFNFHSDDMVVISKKDLELYQKTYIDSITPKPLLNEPGTV
jgi:hypothetical protein